MEDGLVAIADDGEAPGVRGLVARRLKPRDPSAARELVEVLAGVGRAVERVGVEPDGGERRVDDGRSGGGRRRRRRGELRRGGWRGIRGGAAGAGEGTDGDEDGEHGSLRHVSKVSTLEMARRRARMAGDAFAPNRASRQTPSRSLFRDRASSRFGTTVPTRERSGARHPHQTRGIPEDWGPTSPGTEVAKEGAVDIARKTTWKNRKNA